MALGFCVQAYAYDLAVLLTGADVLWIRGMAQKATNIAANWASGQELQFSSKKTEIVLFTHKRNLDLASLSMNGSKLDLSLEAKLLDVTLDCKLTWKLHFTRTTRKATTALMQCRKIVGKIVIVITFYSPSCLGQETAKGPFGLRVKLPPALLSTTYNGGFTLLL